MEIANTRKDKTFFSHFIVFMLAYFFNMGAASQDCSLSIPTISKVRSCPTTLAGWNAEAAKKQCSLIPQSCVPPDRFQYHCVINQWANGTLEVCAPVRKIIGHCAEFNRGRHSILDNQHIKCDSCPSIYISNEAYKYPECYAVALENSVLKDKETESINRNTYIKETVKEDGITTPLIIGIIAVVVFIAVINMTGVIFYIRYTLYRRRTQEYHQMNPQDTAESRQENNPV